VDYVIPGNDDALRSIRLFAAGIAGAVMSGRGIAESANAGAPVPGDGKPKGETTTAATA
jgi:small subunit ribosomal protein S2